MWLLLEIPIDPDRELMPVTGLGKQISGSKTDALAVGNRGSLELATVEMLAASVRSVNGVEKA